MPKITKAKLQEALNYSETSRKNDAAWRERLTRGEVTPMELACMLGLHVNTVHSWLNQGLSHTTPEGFRAVIKVSDVVSWTSARAVASARPIGSMDSTRLTVSQLSKITGIAVDDLTKYFAIEGMPRVDSTEDGNIYSLAPCLAWLFARERREGIAYGAKSANEVNAANLSAIQGRKASAEAAIAEAKLAEQSAKPPALPQLVVDAMDDAADLVRGEITKVIDSQFIRSTAMEWAEDEEVRDLVIELTDLEFRLRKGLDDDFTHHADLRLQASRDALVKSEAKLAETLAECGDTVLPNGATMKLTGTDWSQVSDRKLGLAGVDLEFGQLVTIPAIAPQVTVEIAGGKVTGTAADIAVIMKAAMSVSPKPVGADQPTTTPAPAERRVDDDSANYFVTAIFPNGHMTLLTMLGSDVNALKASDIKFMAERR